MRDALKRRMIPSAPEAEEPEMDMMPPEEEGAIALVKKEDGGSSSEEALAGLEPCVAKLPPDKAEEAKALIAQLGELFKNYEEPSEEVAPVEKGPAEELPL
jgi:hypothetical protein